jgi:hypothetical protein
MTDSVLVQTSVTEAVVLTTDSSTIVAETPVTTVVTSLGQQGPQGIQGPLGPQGPAGPPGPSAAISTASDVDISTLKTGSLLVYSQGTDKWTSTDTLVAQIVDSGQY